MDKLMHEVVTINDIARLSGVSKSTVSRYLNNGSVSNKTKHKIQEVIEATNYSPNSFAQSLKAKKNSLIGTIVPRLDSPSIVESLAGIDKKISSSNYELLILNTYQTPSREKSAIETFVKQKVGGIILFATMLDEDYLAMLQRLSIPVIVVGQKAKGLHNILYSDYQAGLDIGEYITQLGHKKIAYFGVTEADISVGINRKKGLQDGVGKLSKEIEYYETNFKTKDAYELALKVLPTAKATYFTCATDNIALGVLKAARELNLDVPGKISISGFGGSNITDSVSPTITTIKYDYEKAGQTAIESMISLLDGNKVPQEIWIDTQLKIKESTRDIN